MNRFTSILLAGLIASASALAISPKADANTPASYLAELDNYGYQRNDDGNYERHSRQYRNGDYDRQNDLRNIRDDNNRRYDRDNHRRYDRDNDRDNNHRRYERENNRDNNHRRYERENNRRYERENNRRYERDNNLRNIYDNNRRYERDRDWGRG
ncbi:hypothetical protein [Nostoc sp. NMS8]|uniref:hypothetical protein n=1 Tax=Nostoc sp. NMS8 TaxID=2815392 RepID=UPI0025E435B9|nr:hypothetical protein [Nostoc sp. NMS8]